MPNMRAWALPLALLLAAVAAGQGTAVGNDLVWDDRLHATNLALHALVAACCF